MIKLGSPESVGLCPDRLKHISPHFMKYVDDGEIPGYQILVFRRGKTVFLEQYGKRDVENDQPVEEDTIYRFYSMTKAITTVAVMSLYERGLFQLDNPVSEFIPEFENLGVYKFPGDPEFGVTGGCHTELPERKMTIRDLLTHTSGLTYGFMNKHPVDAMYRDQNVNGGTLKDMVQKLGQIPLLFSPGTQWSYSVATDVLGHLVEVLSGTTLDAYFAENILGPLGMVDTAFHVPESNVSRFAANYQFRKGGFRLLDKPSESTYLKPPTFLSGGGGLVSTVEDYLRFTQMLLNKGELDGTRILGRKTVECMTSNHLPNNADLREMGQAVFSETTFAGIGFGLGFSVMLDPAKANIIGSPGEYAWGGAASTYFWIDPVEDMIVIFLTQLMPSSSYPIRRELKVLTYQAIID